ncbi:hypothetical protein AZSI13_21340 [Azospira sp. I13]|uniref:OprD family outer membrane porin n=1 Tax=Azospira sp. I13 TaxID=1765050 RepID=UPI000D47E0A1|nr:OprD family outer membrane porin [Azospira sp. I13]GBG02807.1 hypothetical protein AZSI13_21340 [Azospira sp. I13]
MKHLIKRCRHGSRPTDAPSGETATMASPRRAPLAKRLGSVVLALGSLSPFAPTARAGDDLGQALLGSSAFGYAKIMVVADDKKGGRPNQGTLGVGGKLGLETGEYYGLRFRGALYTSQDLGLRNANPRQTDAYMFDLDKRPYSLLGEAQLRLSAGRTELVLGRQEIFSPLINSYEYRIIPNLYEAYTLINRDLPHTTLTAAYVGKMSGLDSLGSYSRFNSMSRQAYLSLMTRPDGTPDARAGDTADLSPLVGQHGVWMTGLVYENTHRLQLWNYYGIDTLHSLYADGRWKQPLSPNLTAVLEAQAYRVSEVGAFKDYLARHGLNASYSLKGLKGTLAHAPSGISLGLAVNRFGGNERTVTAYGNWGGFPEFVILPYLYPEEDRVSALAGTASARLTALFDLGVYGLKDQSLLLGHARVNIDEALLPGADIRINSLLYRAKLSPRLSARVSLDSRSSGHSRYDNAFMTAALRYDF